MSSPPIGIREGETHEQDHNWPDKTVPRKGEAGGCKATWHCFSNIPSLLSRSLSVSLRPLASLAFSWLTDHWRTRDGDASHSATSIFGMWVTLFTHKWASGHIWAYLHHLSGKSLSCVTHPWKRADMFSNENDPLLVLLNYTRVGSGPTPGLISSLRINFIAPATLILHAALP